MLKVVLAYVPMAHLKGEAVTESPNLGILYIISYVRERLKNVEFHYLEPLLNLEEHLAEVAKLKPDVYCSSFTTQKKALGYEAIQKVKQLVPNALVMAGGAHPTIDPEDVFMNSETDVCVVGEGEETFHELLAALLESDSSSSFYSKLADVKGIAYRDKKGQIQVNPNRELLSDINFLPAWDMVDLSKYDSPVRKKHPLAYLLQARGCPYRCVYCSNPVWKLTKPWLRMRSPENIAEEVKYLYDKGVREIYLRSDTFNTELGWATSVCEKIKELNLKDLVFQCNLRADKMDDDFAEKLNEINCWLVHIGLESVNNRVLKGINKLVTYEDIERTLRTLKKHHIKVYGFFMLYNAWEENGELKYETTEEVENTLETVRKLLKEKLLTYMSWAVANPIIGSQLHDIVEKHDAFSNNKNLPIKLPIPEEEMMGCFKKGLKLQLWNGIVNRQINLRSLKRVRRKLKVILS
jgi:anaerobic magnesium-protoporphyrin IX monomethyl ester cyclase